MATGYHVNGTAELQVATGTGAALELLGHTVNGVHIDPQIIQLPVFTDAGGGEQGVPATFHELGEIHVITADVIVYSEAILAKVRKGASALVNGITEGVMQKAGRILDATPVGGTGVGGLYRLLITSPDDATPRNYLYARLTRAPVRRSTLAMVWGLQWVAIPYVGTGTTMAGVVLFNQTTT
jgi:hypothetical protein